MREVKEYNVVWMGTNQTGQTCVGDFTVRATDKDSAKDTFLKEYPSCEVTRVCGTKEQP